MLTEALHRATKRNPHQVAIAFEEQSWTYSELDQITGQLARNLIAAGIAPGDRVALHLQNRPELAFAFIACFKAGCIAVPVNPRLKGPEIDYILRHSGAAFYVGQPDLYAELERSCPAIASLELRYITDGPSDDRTIAFEHLLRSADPSAALPDAVAGRVAVIVYTSGTTAHPKGVTHSHETLARMATCMRDMELDEKQVVLIMSSMAHLVGFAMLFLSGLLNGATIVISRQMEYTKNLEAWARWRCTYTLALPVMFDGLARTRTAVQLDVSSGPLFFCGGDCLSPAVKQTFEAKLGPVFEMYGATEMAPICRNRPGAARPGSLGLPGEGTDVRLVDSNGHDTSPGEVGEVYVRGAHLMTGYWREPDATAKALQDGWFRTGDLARRGPGGYYYFAGRKKEIIIRGGSNISPQEVEAVLYEHPAVSEAGVIGCPDAVWGESVVAYVALRPGRAVTESELIAYARERLADYKTPERIHFLDVLPKGPSGKIQRRALREAEFEHSLKGEVRSWHQ